MNKKIYIIVILHILLTTSIFSDIVKGSSDNQNSLSAFNYYEKGFRYNIQGWVYIHIEGEPYERGYQYGYLASAEIVDTIYRWSHLAHSINFMELFIIKSQLKNYDKLSEQWWKICKYISINTFLKQVPKEYKQEMKGITDGVKAKNEKIYGRDIEFEDIVAANFVQDCLFAIKFYKNRFHPFHGIFNFNYARTLLSSQFKSIFKSIKILENTQHPGHCSAFIATGDATSDKGIVIAQSIYFDMLIAQRCNIILDVQPSKGYRFIMTSPPGSIWSQEDFYQNDQGIVITETELPQGPWKKGGTPKGVRSRRAIQYSDSIDNVIESLKDGNNGLIPNEWLIGDTKTGEIAIFEQALFNTFIKRTFNGFFASYTAPHDKKVRRELLGIIDFFPNISKKFYDSRAVGRDEKFMELEKQYYGKIDEKIAKKILATHPICLGMNDGKITSSRLMENLGLLAFMGNPNGIDWKPTDEIKKVSHMVTELPAIGWVELYPAISKPKKLHSTINYNNIKKTGVVLWKCEIDGAKNMNSSSNVVSEDIVYTSTSSGMIYALDAGKGEPIWNKKIGENIVNHDVAKNLVVIGTDCGVCAINKEKGDVKWHRYIGETYSKPVIVNNLVITSCSDGNLYAFDIESGKIEWNFKLPYSGIISEGNHDNICIVSGNKCYCFNIKIRDINWKFETAGKITAPPRVEGNKVYLGSWDGNVYAIDPYSGDIKWTFKTGWGIDTTPVVSEGKVFVGSNDNNFYALDENNGDLVWFFTCKSAIHSSPAVYGEYVFFGSDDGRLYALNKKNGDLAWSYSPGYSIDNDDVNNYITTPILSDPFIKNGIVYISVKGNIYALDAQTTEMLKDNYSEKTNQNDDLLSLVIYLLLFILGIALLILTYLKKNH